MCQTKAGVSLFVRKSSGSDGGKIWVQSQNTQPFPCLLQILWIIPQKVVRWVLVVFSLCLSGSVLVMTFWPAVRDDNRRIAVATVATILLLHALLAIGCLVGHCRSFSLISYFLGQVACHGKGKEGYAGHWRTSSVKIPVVLNVVEIDAGVTLTVLVINSIINYGVIEYLQVGGDPSGSSSPTSTGQS